MREKLPLEHETTSLQVLVRDLDHVALLEGARARGNAHIGELMRRHGPQLRVQLAGYAGDLTEEVVVDTFLSLPKALAAYREEGRFDKWLFSVAFNIARTRRRSRIRHERHFEDTEREGVRLPSAAAKIDEAEWVQRASHSLSPAEREVWFLSYQGHTRDEIAETLRIKPSAVDVRLHRARTRLEKLAKEE